MTFWRGKKRSYPPLSYTSDSGYRHTESSSYSAKCVLTNHWEIGNIFSLGFRGGWLFCYLSLESGTHAWVMENFKTSKHSPNSSFNPIIRLKQLNKLRLKLLLLCLLGCNFWLLFFFFSLVLPSPCHKSGSYFKPSMARLCLSKNRAATAP